LQEVQRRLENGKRKRPELEAAAQEASLSLKRLASDPAKPGRPASLLQEGQRKAVRAAVLAGAAPAHMAKHFGLLLAAVRKVLGEAT
jgi:hypothetical protein